MSLGIIAALVAMLCWGFGDFLIQRSTRSIGDWETLFLITIFGCVALLPFVADDLPAIFSGLDRTLWIIIASGVFLFVAALLEFEALKEGKISVIEPTWSLEIPTAAILAAFILNESLSSIQTFAIIGLIAGLILVSYRSGTLHKRFLFEKGVRISILAALLMGITNFFVGWGARETDPLIINFFISGVSLVGSGIFLIAKGKLVATFRHIISYPKTVIPMMILDNVAWIAFAYGLALAPIGITVALSESYIIIAVLLGIFVGREKLERHQYVGLLTAIIAAITLAITTG